MIFAIIIIAVSSAFLWISGTFLKEGVVIEKNPNASQELKNMSNSLNEFPLEMRGELQTLALKYPPKSGEWHFDPINNEIIFRTYSGYNESIMSDIQGKQIGDYTIRVMNDTDILESEPDVIKQLVDLRKKPEYQIVHFSMATAPFSDPEGFGVELWVNNSTPENKYLNYKVIKGWEIQVYPVSPMPNSST